jgi:uncharacterized protein (TIGR02145 family)
MKSIFKIFILSFSVLFFSNCSKDNSESQAPQSTKVTDIEGNVYNTIKIGTQTWTLENLKTKTFNDGTPITKHTNGMDWGDLTNQLPQYQWADTSDLNNAVDGDIPFDFYGAMYNHWAIESGKLAPIGWRIPSREDFKKLENFLSANGYNGIVASSLKSTSGWITNSGNGTNATGFNGLPNGYTNTFGGPTGANVICTWATTNVNTSIAIGSRTRVMAQLHNTNAILYSENSIRIGSGVRCIKND